MPVRHADRPATKPQFSAAELRELHEKGTEILKHLESRGLYKPLGSYRAQPEDGKVTYGEGYPITAFEKFLGYWKKDANLAFSPSISMVTDFSVVRCFCRYVREPGRDKVFLDGESNERYDKRARKALDNFRSITGITGSFEFTIERVKRYDKAKGLGESAAVAAATARALIANVFGEDAAHDDIFVSRFARFASGSGTRSAAGGMSIWIAFPEIEESQSYACRLDVDTSNFHFAVFPDFHNIQTMDAHGIASSSPFYPTWVINKYDRILKLIKSGPKIEDLMRNAQEDMFFLRSLLTSGGVIIDTERSIKLINAVKSFQQSGGNIFMTADTGPSIVVMSTDEGELKRFIATQSAKPLYGKIPQSVNYSPDPKAAHTASAFLESLR
ncbi:MAG: mevalonate pyrophosphate decarboxylase [Candidatus Micrarchaeota archaeon]|nr:mevalonate pyrophosphate decarboxylase [Candidatus Micrarchaeota archaeon]